MNDLSKIRRSVNEIDNELVKLLAKRLNLVKKVALEKIKNKLSIVDIKREKEVLARVGKKALQLGLDKSAIKNIFEEIISLSKNKQINYFSDDNNKKKKLNKANIRIAFQGEHGAYSELAILRNFPKARTYPCKQFNDVFKSVENNEADCALLPIENSTHGSVIEVYDLLLKYNISAVYEIFLRVEHMLITNVGVKLSNIKKVYSHPQALAQCSDYINENSLKAEQFYDTAGALMMLKVNKLTDCAAIAGVNAANLYKMQILSRNIENNMNNYTRFLLIANKEKTQAIRKLLNIRKIVKYKTSIIFCAKHVPGSLVSILKEVSNKNINLTKIESRPLKTTPWEYIFYVDFEGNIKDRKIHDVITKIKRRTTYLKIMGSYPSGA